MDHISLFAMPSGHSQEPALSTLVANTLDSVDFAWYNFKVVLMVMPYIILIGLIVSRFIWNVDSDNIGNIENSHEQNRNIFGSETERRDDKEGQVVDSVSDNDRKNSNSNDSGVEMQNENVVESETESREDDNEQVVDPTSDNDRKNSDGSGIEMQKYDKNSEHGSVKEDTKTAKAGRRKRNKKNKKEAELKELEKLEKLGHFNNNMFYALQSASA